MNGIEGGLTIVVPDGESHYTLLVVTCLGRRRGNRVHVVSSDPDARVRLSRHCASFTVVPGDDEDARFGVVRRAIDRHRAHVVLPVCETGTRLLQGHVRALRDRVAIAPFEGALDLGDKWRLAEILGELGIPQPPTVLYTADTAFRRRLASLPLPVLIKPRQMSGGYGIREFGDHVTLVSFLEDHPEMAYRYVVQTLVPGHDVVSSVLCRKGVVLAQSTQRPASAVAKRYGPATEIEMIDHPEASRTTRRLFEGLGWSGIANVDLREDERDGSLSVIDVNPRYWSSLLASHAAGVDFPHLASLAALGVGFAPPAQRAQRFLQAKSSLRAWGESLRNPLGAPSPHETIWPYLLADPVPHLLGRFRRGRAESPTRVEAEARTRAA